MDTEHSITPPSPARVLAERLIMGKVGAVFDMNGGKASTNLAKADGVSGPGSVPMQNDPNGRYTEISIPAKTSDEGDLGVQVAAELLDLFQGKNVPNMVETRHIESDGVIGLLIGEAAHSQLRAALQRGRT